MHLPDYSNFQRRRSSTFAERQLQDRWMLMGPLLDRGFHFFLTQLCDLLIVELLDFIHALDELVFKFRLSLGGRQFRFILWGFGCTRLCGCTLLRLHANLNVTGRFIFLTRLLFNDDWAKSFTRTGRQRLPWTGERGQFVSLHAIKAVPFGGVVSSAGGDLVILKLECFLDGSEGLLLGGIESIFGVE